MEYQESLEQEEGNLDMKEQIIKNQALEIKQLKAEKKLDQAMIEKLTLEVEFLKNNQSILKSEIELIKNQIEKQDSLVYEKE